MGWPKVAKQKRRRRFGDLRRLVLVKILSQPQVRAYRAKPIKEILAAGCVVHLLAVHETKITRPDPLSSLAAVSAGRTWRHEVRTSPPMHDAAPWNAGFIRQVCNRRVLLPDK